MATTIPSTKFSSSFTVIWHFRIFVFLFKPTYKFTYYTIILGFGIFWIALPTSSTRLPRRNSHPTYKDLLVTCNSFLFQATSISKEYAWSPWYPFWKRHNLQRLHHHFLSGLLLEFHAPLASLDSCKANLKAV
jgi:hypothetical protein